MFAISNKNIEIKGLLVKRQDNNTTSYETADFTSELDRILIKYMDRTSIYNKHIDDPCEGQQYRISISI